MRSRKLLLVCTALATVHLAVVLKLGTSPTGSLFSNIIQFVSALIAGVACFVAARRSHGFARLFWVFMSATFGIWSVAQSAWLYYENYLHSHVPLPSLGYFLAFFSFAPAAMLLFIDPDADLGGQIDWLRTSDFIQVSILLVCSYLYFFQIPALSFDRLGQSITYVFDVRNILISLGFLARGFTAHSRGARALFQRMGAVLSLYAVGVFVSGHVMVWLKIPTGSIFDLTWSVPFLIAAVLALGWREPQLPIEALQEPRSSTKELAALVLLPMSVPLVVLAMSSRIAMGQVLVAGVAVLGSILAYSVRLVVTTFRRDRALAALRESEARFRSLFEGNPQPTLVYDPQSFRILEVNSAATTHYQFSRDEFLTMRLSDILQPGEFEKLSRYLSEGSPLSHLRDWRHMIKGGRLIDVEVNAQTISFAGRPARLVVVRDVTERKRLEEQLRHSQKMEAVGTLAGGVAHDFNNLLTVITGYGQLLLEKRNNDQSEELQQILDAADRASSLTRQLLTFSRRQVLQPANVHLGEVLQRMEKMLRRLIGEDVELLTRSSEDLWMVEGDPGQMDQIIMNLAVNAREAMPCGGSLHFEAANVTLSEAEAKNLGVDARPGDHVALRVRDTGEGIAPEVQAHIFEPFFTTKAPGKGTGLGLALIYGIVKQSSGWISVQSELGKGTCFTVYLPPVKKRVEHCASAAKNQAVRHSETVLLVEDDPSVRALSQRILEQHGYRVLAASESEEAERACAHYFGRIDAAILDVVMPGLSGPELAGRLLRRRPAMKVLYVSGYTDRAVALHGLVANSPFLQKPFTPEALAAKLNELLRPCDVA